MARGRPRIPGHARNSFTSMREIVLFPRENARNIAASATAVSIVYLSARVPVLHAAKAGPRAACHVASSPLLTLIYRRSWRLPKLSHSRRIVSQVFRISRGRLSTLSTTSRQARVGTRALNLCWKRFSIILGNTKLLKRGRLKFKEYHFILLNLIGKWKESCYLLLWKRKPITWHGITIIEKNRSKSLEEERIINH